MNVSKFLFVVVLIFSLRISSVVAKDQIRTITVSAIGESYLTSNVSRDVVQQRAYEDAISNACLKLRSRLPQLLMSETLVSNNQIVYDRIWNATKSRVKVIDQRFSFKKINDTNEHCRCYVELKAECNLSEYDRILETRRKEEETYLQQLKQQLRSGVTELNRGEWIRRQISFDTSASLLPTAEMLDAQLMSINDEEQFNNFLSKDICYIKTERNNAIESVVMHDNIIFKDRYQLEFNCSKNNFGNGIEQYYVILAYEGNDWQLYEDNEVVELIIDKSSTKLQAELCHRYVKASTRCEELYIPISKDMMLNLAIAKEIQFKVRGTKGKVKGEALSNLLKFYKQYVH